MKSLNLLLLLNRTVLARKPSVNLLYLRHRELAEADLRISGSSSAWCSAHNVSTAAGRMFEDPGLLRSASASSLGVWNNNQAGQFMLAQYLQRNPRREI